MSAFRVSYIRLKGGRVTKSYPQSSVPMGQDSKMLYHRKVTGLEDGSDGSPLAVQLLGPESKCPRTHIKLWTRSHALSYPSTVSGRGRDRRVGVTYGPPAQPRFNGRPCLRGIR